MEIYSYTREDLEDTADFVKSKVLESLVRQKLLDQTIAEEWSKEHTIVVRRKTFFRTITDLWSKQEFDKNNFFYLVVKKV